MKIERNRERKSEDRETKVERQREGVDKKGREIFHFWHKKERNNYF